MIRISVWIVALIDLRSSFQFAPALSPLPTLCMKRSLEKVEPSGSSRSSGRSSGQGLDKQARQELRSELVAQAGGSKASIARVLKLLQQRGLLLDEGLGCEDEERQLTAAASHHARAKTPYGLVVQTLGLEMCDGSIYSWDIVNPFAYIWYLAQMCPQFADVMLEAVARTADGMLSLLLYWDELVPSNPLRPDEARKVFAVYYAFLEWPAWMLHNSDAWILFGALKTKVVHNVRGGVSAVVASIIRLTFVTRPANFTSGVFIDHRNGSKLVQATLKGIIADELGLKGAFDLKGASGTKPCPNCQNIFNFIHKDPSTEKQL